LRTNIVTRVTDRCYRGEVPPPPLEVAIVATWYPSSIDPVKGRFVADQVAALVAGGATRASVVSFDPAQLIGTAAMRDRQAAAVMRVAGGAIEHADDIFTAGAAGGVGDVPVARLPVPDGRTRSHPRDHALHHRVAPLLALARRWTAAAADPGLPPPPELIHAHTGYPDGAAAAAMARQLGVPLVITEHASFVDRLIAVPEIRAAYVAAGRQAARVIVVSATLAAELRAALPELADRLIVVPNTIPVDDFRAAPLAERRADELLFVGYRLEAKGIDELLRAFALARARRPSVTLRLIGGNTNEALEDRWRALAASLGVADAVAFEPAADRAAVAEAMARASLFVHPSRRETFGIVAAEALASGTPVVTTASGGVPEILGPDPEAVGAVVPIGDPGRLAAAIVTTLERRAAFDPLHLRRAVVDRYAAPAVAARLREIYAAALEEARVTRPATAGAVPEARTAGADAAEHRAGDPPRVVVALDPERARRVAGLDAAARAGVVLVTSRGTWDAEAGGFAAAILADLRGQVRATADAAALGPRAAGWRRVTRIARHPLAAARRRGLLPGLEGLLRTRGDAAVRAGLARAAESADDQAPIRLVCLDGIDYTVGEAMITEGLARPEPGGVRWLGDRAARAGTLGR
jgi:glycogen(starch) synthase